MKNETKNKVIFIIQKYKYNVILTLVIFILFLISTYSYNENNYKLYLNDKLIPLEYEIQNVSQEPYIHVDDLTMVFKDNIYYDKISGKLIITTENKIEKISRSDETLVQRVDSELFFRLKYVMQQLGYNVCEYLDKIYVTDYEYIEATVLKNRVGVHNEESIICFLDKDSKVNIQIDDNLINNESKLVNVNCTVNGKIYYGFVLKDNLAYEYEVQEEVITGNNVIIAKVEKTIGKNTDLKKVDIFVQDMLRLSGVSSIVELDYTNNLNTSKEVYATINNGQKSSNYDPDITSGMLSSESNRTVIIEKIKTYLKENELDGINIDFSNIRTTDKIAYTQFIKELAAVMHSEDKNIMLTITNTNLVDLTSVTQFVDYVVIKVYNARTIASKTSGPISSVDYVENLIQSIVSTGTDVQKVIIEIPAYSILWTEKKGTIINAEIYNMLAMGEYIKLNELEINFDKVSNQNYISCTKGITTYKMWLEDEYSIKTKVELVNKYNLAGVSIYKSGMETSNVYNTICGVLNK